jgi:hypothetical protein
MPSEKPLIFISCGQHADSEKQLGKDICSLIEELRPDVTPYFAEYQSTVEGLSNQILRSLHRAAGLICVMHKRGDIQTPAGQVITRGSVWVEQEIAITAFMTHVLDRSIPILFYKEAGLSVEGIRSVLLMNPRVDFTQAAQVITDLRSALPSAAFTPFNSYEVVPVLSYRRLASSNADRHVYELTADVKNVGEQQVTDFELRVFFPRAFLNPRTMWPEVEGRRRSTESHICLRANAERAPGGLYPDDSMQNPLKIEFYVDHDLDDDPRAMASTISVELDSGSMPRKKRIYPIRDFIDF